MSLYRYVRLRMVIDFDFCIMKNWEVKFDEKLSWSHFIQPG